MRGLLSGVLATVMLVAPACEREDAAPPVSTPGAVAPTIDTKAARLVRDLTDRLDGHVFLVSFLAEQAVVHGIGSEHFKQAREEVEGDTHELNKIIAGVYMAETGATFEDVWKRQVEAYVTYTRGKIEERPELVREARAKLDEFRTTLVEFLQTITDGKLDQEAVSRLLEEHVRTQLAAIDAFVAEEPRAITVTYEAAHTVMPELATQIGKGMVEALEKRFEGEADSRGVRLLRDLTDLLGAHSYTGGFLMDVGALHGVDSPWFEEAKKVLEENAGHLGDVLGGVYGADAGERFTSLWRERDELLAALAEAISPHLPTEKVAEVADRLKANAGEIGSFLQDVTDGLVESQAVVNRLSAATDDLEAAGKEFFAKKAAFHAVNTAAAKPMPDLAFAVASAAVEQFPAKFG